MKNTFIVTFIILIAFSCQQGSGSKVESVIETASVSAADSIISLAQMAHGTAIFDSKKFEFTFRDKKYSFDYKNDLFTRSDTADWRFIEDFYQGAEFWREINGDRVMVNAKDQAKFSESINSVIYFVTLPYKLTDAAVVAVDKGRQTIKSQNYNAVEVKFVAEGGGVDYQDIFYYWFNANTHAIDYFAYQYETNGGGVRFREAINQVEVAGVVFQDYVNYEVAVGTPLHEIPALFEMDSLKELSRIENIDVKVAE